MRRVILAGVGLTLTACGFSATPPSQPTASKPAAQPDTYVSALADTEQCTLWREVAGQRQCLDGAQAAAPAKPAAAAPKAPPPAAAPRLAVTSQPLDAPAPAVVSAAPAAPAPHPADAALAEMKPTGPNLFEEMRKLGMIKPGAGETTPGFVAVAPVSAPPASTAPALPSLPAAGQPMLAAAKPPVSNVSAFADTAPKAAPAPARPAAPAVASVVTQSWAPVEPPKLQEPRVQLAASTPGVGELQERSPVTAAQRAPVTPVERAELPTVRSNAVVPLKITQKATEDAPAVVQPAVAAVSSPVPGAGRQVAQASAPALPSLPALPALPSASSAPVSGAPTPVATSPAPVSKPVALAAPALPSAPAPTPAPAVSSSSLPSVPPASTGWSTTTKVTHAATPAPAPAPAKVIPAAAPAKQVAATKAAPAKAAAAPAKVAGGKYLVLQSFQERERADRLASRYRGLDAQVASVSLKGQTWHRVVVRDGASARRQLASDGVRGFWPTSL
ncbi:MAG: hypothetical protein JNM89_12830 [Hyphomicrobiaceae bacterium]|nr:hypothetical protein [Hyphomicrobiaceae bacterium]